MSWKINPNNSKAIVHRLSWIFLISGIIATVGGLYYVYYSVNIFGPNDFTVYPFELYKGLVCLLIGLILIYTKLHLRKIR